MNKVVISVIDLKENAYLPSCEEDRGGFLQRGFSHLISVAREREEQSVKRWMRLPTGTSGAPNMARLPNCGDAGQRKGGDYRNIKEVLELGKSKWQQKIGCGTRQSCNVKPKPDDFGVRWVLDNESLKKGTDLLMCSCTPTATVQLKK